MKSWASCTVVDFSVGYAEAIVSVITLLFSHAKLFDYLLNQSFGESNSHVGGGPFVTQPLNHLVNHLLYEIVDKEVNRAPYQSNLTPSSTWGVTSCCVWNTFLSTRHFIFAVTYSGTCTIFATIITCLRRCCYLPQVDIVTTRCIIVTLNSSHAMKLAVALPSQQYRTLYVALAI
jgi:hypothetical protein